MAMSSTLRSATDYANKLAGAPVLLGRNIVKSYSAMRWDANGDMSGGGDISATGYPATRACDDRLDSYTKPNAAATQQFFCIDFGAAGVAFDSFVLVWSVIAGSLELNDDDGYIAVYVSDEADFSDSAPLFTMSPVGSSYPLVGGNKRLAVLDFISSPGASYSGVRYLCVNFVGTAALIPAVHEFWLGTQYQLPRRPVYPFQSDNYFDRLAEFESDSGLASRYVKDQNVWRYDAKILLTSTTERSAALTWRSAVGPGTVPLWIIEDATSTYQVGGQTPLNTPRVRHCWLSGDGIQAPRVGPLEWELGLQATEISGRTLYDEEGAIY